MLKAELSALQQNVLSKGAEALSDTDLLGIALGSCNLARTLVHDCVNWHRLGPHALGEIPRLSPARVATVLALVELSRRIVSVPLVRGESLTCSDRVIEAYGPRLCAKDQECFIALALDTKHRVVAEHEIARGSIDAVPVDPRLVFRRLLADGAAAAITIHNHPSGDPTPSLDDRRTCTRLCQAGELVGVKLLDFVVVAATGSVSFAEQGMMGGAP